MSSTIIASIDSEINLAKEMLYEIPVQNVIEKMGMEGRLKNLEELKNSLCNLPQEKIL